MDRKKTTSNTESILRGRPRPLWKRGVPAGVSLNMKMTNFQ